MGEFYWWIYDAAFILIFFLCIYSSAKKGFSGILILVTGCVVSVFISSLISQKSSPYIYNTFIKRSSLKSVQEALVDYSPALGVKEAVEQENFGAVLDETRVKNLLESDDSIEMLYEYTNQSTGYVVVTHENYINILTSNFAELFAKQIGVKLPPYVVRELTQRMSGNSELFVETTKLLLKSPKNVPEYIEKNYIREPALKLVRAFVFVISYFTLMMIIRVVVYKVIRFGLLNGYDRLDHFAGGVFGVVQAAAVVIIGAVLVKIMIQVAESKGSFISYETIEQTKLFRYVFDYIEKY